MTSPSSPQGSATPAMVADAAYRAWLWLDERAAAFPAAARRQLGHRLVEAALQALVSTTQAVYSRRGAARLALLDSANRELAVARVLLRGARDRRHLSVSQHEHAMVLVDDWGRQLGGWRRSEAVAHGGAGARAPQSGE